MNKQSRVILALAWWIVKAGAAAGVPRIGQVQTRYELGGEVFGWVGGCTGFCWSGRDTEYIRYVGSYSTHRTDRKRQAAAGCRDGVDGNCGNYYVHRRCMCASLWHLFSGSGTAKLAGLVSRTALAESGPSTKPGSRDSSPVPVPNTSALALQLGTEMLCTVPTCTFQGWVSLQDLHSQGRLGWRREGSDCILVTNDKAGKATPPTGATSHPLGWPKGKKSTNA
jgi:hypothetical protein